MKNRIIIFSNIKGGVGKTPLCALFANRLIEHGVPTIVIDADLQASLYRHRQREQTIGYLGLVGTVTPVVKQSVAVKRYSTLYPLEKSQTEILEPAFNKIIEELDLKK